MQHTPDLQQFASLAAEHDFVPVYRRLLSDSLTPVTAFQLLDDGGPACLFESVIGGEKVGRYSFLAVGPVASAFAVATFESALRFPTPSTATTAQ